MTASQDSYTLKSAQGSTTYARKGHWAVEVDNAQGKRVVPETQQLKPRFPVRRHFVPTRVLADGFRSFCPNFLARSTATISKIEPKLPRNPSRDHPAS
ncbi:MAG: hypothetical protein HC765_10865 [Brachymonas sp.]|nr:hypothetical protein [Brachymonas sp.]